MTQIVAVTSNDDGIYAFAADGRVWRGVTKWDTETVGEWTFTWESVPSVPLAPPEPAAPPVPEGWEVQTGDMQENDALTFDMAGATLWSVAWRNEDGSIWVRHLEGKLPPRFSKEGLIQAAQVTRVYRRKSS